MRREDAAGGGVFENGAVAFADHVEGVGVEDDGAFGLSEQGVDGLFFLFALAEAGTDDLHAGVGEEPVEGWLIWPGDRLHHDLRRGGSCWRVDALVDERGDESGATAQG